MKVFFVLIVFFLGCGAHYYPEGSYVPGSPNTIWMHRGFGVGKQCVQFDWQPEYEQKLEHIKAELADEGIRVFEEDTRKMATCRSCNCAALVGRYFVRVHSEEEDRVTMLGFVLSMPPSEQKR